uniref:WD_REPEATS_REGION domain-containing protein n=1 Tax=Globodera rostochiensis TaxID=31243 RepID=A0A914GXQ8_GLORO
MTISEKINSFGANSLLLPVVLWGPKSLKSRIVRISSVQNGRIILTGSTDGQVMQWIVDEALGWIQPQMVLLAHESAISCISPICSSNTSKFVTCSEDGAVCLWDSIDGRVIDSVKSNCIHRTIKPYTLKNGAQNILFCIGDYADVIVLHPYDLNVLFTLGSRIEPDWIASIALASPMDVLIGTSLSGVIKLWSLHGLDPKETGSVLFESESKVMGTDGVRSIVCSDKNLRIMLVVCGSSWQIIDPSTLNQLIVSECAIEALEGIIVDIDKVAIAFADSTIVLFQLPRRKLCGKQVREKFGENPANVFNIEQPFVFALLKGTLSSTLLKPSLAPVQFYFDESKNSGKKVAYRVDQQGSISLWNIPKNLEFLVNEFIRNRRPIVYEPTIKQHISEAWARLVPPPPTLVETEDDRTVTATIYVGTQGKLFHGFDDGSIMMMNACHAIMAQLLEGFCNDFAPYRLLADGHSARVNCFAYPFADSARYDPNLLLSGGADFAVIVWNITLGERVHRFCCQGGPILRFVVPPTNCSMRVLNSICAIAGDNSAALLSLKELKCILLASRQQFPIIDVRWRPLDDFLLLRCEDSSVYVWQIETANLDRIVAGLTTDEVMDACTEQLDISPGDDVENELFASHPVQILRALKQKNIAALRKIAGHVDGKQAEVLSSIELVRLSPPMDILQLHNCSDKAHLILFNIDSLIAGLLSLDCELCATESDGNLASANFDCLSGTDGRALFTSLITKRIATMHQGNGIYHLECERGEFGLLSSAVPSNTIKNPSNTSLSSTFLVQQQSLYMDTAKLLISLLHGWDFDEEVDRACLNSLKLCRPKLPICFGTVTKKGNLSLYTPYCSGKISALDDFSYKYFSRSVHWHESRALTTVHLLSIVALSNTLMTLKSKSNQLAVKKPPLKRNSSIKSSDFLAENESQQIRQGWSNVASLHCVLLSELIKPSDAYATPRIDLLARKWQNDCIEIRDAAQALLVRELTRLGSEGRRRLIERWSNFLPTVLDSGVLCCWTSARPQQSRESRCICRGKAHLNIQNESSASFVVVGGFADGLVQNDFSFCQRKHNQLQFKLDERQTRATATACGASDSSSDSQFRRPALVGLNKCSRLFNGRRVIKLMSQVSFQPPVNASLSSLDDPYQQCASSVLIANKLQEDQMLLCGGVHQVHRNQATSIVLLGAMGAEFPNDLQRNIDLCRATALSLLELLLTPESPLIPANSPLRRAAIDLLGRGFVIWQPHLDLSKTILGLLNLASAEGEKPDTSLPILFTSEADASRTARHALSLIALSRPQALITTLSTEVARYNAVAQHQTIQHSIQSPLMRARNEVLRLLEQLSDKQYNFVVDLIIPVGEVLVHCLDLPLLKQRSLLDLFPSIAKFYMVAYCPNTRRLAFGGKNGAIIVHELRASKAQTVQAHRAPITALAFSQDGKYLAAYAAQDAKISFWQTQQTFLGMGQSQIRCTKSVPAPGEFPVISPGGSYQPFRARLVWINSKSLTLMLPNGKENRFTV